MASSVSVPIPSITQTITSATGALLEGDHGGALTLLQSALTGAKAGLIGQESPLLQQLRLNIPFGFHTLSLGSQECHESSEQSSCPTSLFTFFDAAIIPEEMSPELELAFCTELSAMILYNLGLIYHRIAVATGSTAYFCKAIKLYDVSASIVFAQDSETYFSHGIATLKMVLYVNMGHIYSNFLDQSATAQCVHGMHGLLASLDSASLTPEMRKLFVQNMFVTPNQYSMTLAPAA